MVANPADSGVSGEEELAFGLPAFNKGIGTFLKSDDCGKCNYQTGCKQSKDDIEIYFTVTEATCYKDLNTSDHDQSSLEPLPHRD
ncbi:hypothetical protein U0070_019324 [Myodes glareolus]|uniref:Uncharacterized protein n=1 Tax=Myodes glareolus TaxID=447135 RepID=A0AAW0I7E8_MYOGA